MKTIHFERSFCNKFVRLIDKRFSYNGRSDDIGGFHYNAQYSARCPPGDSSCVGLGTSASGLGFADYLMGPPVILSMQPRLCAVEAV